MSVSLKEGGPGSGVAYRNTAPMDMPMSEYISVGTRKGLTQNGHWDEQEIPLDMITKVGQKNYVPSKVSRMMQDRSILRQKPIDVLWVRGDGYHLVDGHHRYMAAKRLNIESLPARVFTKAEKTMPDYAQDNPDREAEMGDATRTTTDAENPGGFDMGTVRESMVRLSMAALHLKEGRWAASTKVLSEDCDPIELNAMLQKMLARGDAYSVDERLRLAEILDGDMDGDGSISWSDEAGKHVLSFTQDMRIAELQDVTGVYKFDKAEERLFGVLSGIIGGDAEVVGEAYTGFKKLVRKLKKRGATNPKALAATIGRKKYGAKGFSTHKHG